MQAAASWGRASRSCALWAADSEAAVSYLCELGACVRGAWALGSGCVRPEVKPDPDSDFDPDTCRVVLGG